MPKREHFNFRDVLNELGIPLSNKADWAAGHVLRKFAESKGVEPARILTKKTDSNPSVAAPHAIAHYPMSLFNQALNHFRERFEDERRQLGMFSD